MASFSKLPTRQKELFIPYNCYEVGHTWTPFCSEAAVEVGLECLRESLKMYTPLYLATLAFHRKYSYQALYKTLQSIITSSCFLSFNAFSFIASMCTIRKITGRWSFLQCAFFPGLIANFLAIAIERPNRRQALALYCTNLASETLFRMAVCRDLVSPVKNGEVAIFSVVMASFLYLIRKNGFDSDFVSFGLRFILGSEEAKPRTKKKPTAINSNCFPQKSIKSAESKTQRLISKKLSELVQFITALLSRGRSLAQILQLSWLNKVQMVPRHSSCPHKYSCFSYILKGFLKPFLLGYTVSVALGLASARMKLLTNFKRILHKVVTNKLSLNFSLFLGGFAGVFKLVNCLLRWVRGKDSEIHAIPAGLLAGSCMLLAPNPSVSSYLAWKLVEQICNIGIDNGTIPTIPGFPMILYAVSTAVLFYTAVLEPHNVKPTYLNFLNRISANRLTEINRHVLDIFGVHSSRLYHTFWPELDFEHTSRSFQETVLVWMIH